MFKFCIPLKLQVNGAYNVYKYGEFIRFPPVIYITFYDNPITLLIVELYIISKECVECPKVNLFVIVFKIILKPVPKVASAVEMALYNAVIKLLAL